LCQQQVERRGFGDELTSVRRIFGTVCSPYVSNLLADARDIDEQATLRVVRPVF
jgi:hypothetical protein